MRSTRATGRRYAVVQLNLYTGRKIDFEAIANIKISKSSSASDRHPVSPRYVLASHWIFNGVPNPRRRAASDSLRVTARAYLSNRYETRPRLASPYRPYRTRARCCFGTLCAQSDGEAGLLLPTFVPQSTCKIPHPAAISTAMRSDFSAEQVIERSFGSANLPDRHILSFCPPN